MFTFTLNEQDATLIIRALAELPYKMSASLIINLQGQAKNQQEQSFTPKETAESIPV